MIAVMASPRPRRYARRSQGMSPWRGSDPDSRGRRCLHRDGVPIVRAAAVVRCHAVQIEDRSAGRPTGRSRPRLRPHHVRRHRSRTLQAEDSAEWADAGRHLDQPSILTLFQIVAVAVLGPLRRRDRPLPVRSWRGFRLWWSPVGCDASTPRAGPTERAARRFRTRRIGGSR